MKENRPWGAPRLAAVALVATAFLGPTVARASSAPDWAKRAAASDDPSWQPESDAIVLFESTDATFLPPSRATTGEAKAGPVVHFLERGAVRIRTEEGRPKAYAVLGYNPNDCHILSATAWVMSAGGKVAAYGRRDFTDVVAVYNSLVWDFRRGLQFTSADKVGLGDVVAWEFEYDESLAFSEFTEDLRLPSPILHRELTVTPAPGDAVAFSTSRPDLLTPQPGPKPGSLRWEVTRLACLPRQLPTAFHANPLSIRVRLLSGGHGAPTWADVSAETARVIESRIDPSGAEVVGQVARDLTGKSGKWDRIRSLCQDVQESITYLEIVEDRDGLAGYRPHPPSYVLHNRYGDCKDKATLLVSELRSIGETARIVLINQGSPLAAAGDWPSAFFNHAIVMIRGDGSEPATWPKVDTADGGHWILFDPTNRDTPLGVLPPLDGAGLGLVVAEKGGELVRLPVAGTEGNGAILKLRLTLGPDNLLQARIAEDFRGTLAAQRHTDRRDRTAEQYGEHLESRVHEANSLCRDLHWKDDWDPNKAHFHLDFDFTVPSFGRRMPNGLIRVSPDVIPSNFRPAPWAENADGAVFFGPDSLDEEIVLHVPDGYAVDELPEGMKRKEPRLEGEISFASEGAEIVMKKRISREPGFYDRAQYIQLRAFYREFREAERGSVVLRPLAAKS